MAHGLWLSEVPCRLGTQASLTAARYDEASEGENLSDSINGPVWHGIWSGMLVPSSFETFEKHFDFEFDGPPPQLSAMLHRRRSTASRIPMVSCWHGSLRPRPRRSAFLPSLCLSHPRYPVRMAVVDLDAPPPWFAAQARDHLTTDAARQLAGTAGVLSSRGFFTGFSALTILDTRS